MYIMLFSNRKICIVGAGGFGREVLCCLIDIITPKGLQAKDIACFMVGDEHYNRDVIMDVPVIKQSAFEADKYDVVVAIGEPAARRRIVESLPANTHYVTLIHPSAVISEWVTVGKGSVVTAGCILTCNIEIGDHAHLNLHTTVGHDCRIGNYFTTAPAANISGNCIFGEEVYFGTNTSIRQGVTVCSKVTIGMGGVVIKNVAEPGVYIGNPLKKLERQPALQL